MKPRIRYVNPVGTGELDSYFFEQLELVAGNDALIEVCHLELDDVSEGPFLPRLPFYQSTLLEAVKQAEDDGCDGVVIGCSGDPALFEARRMLTIPVTAPLEAALHLAAVLRPRVAILVADGFSAHILYRDLARHYGLEHLISEILTVPMEYPDPTLVRDLMRDDPNRACELVLERHRAVLSGAARELARGAVERGAGAIYAGCTLWTGEMLDLLREAVDVPVIDPAAAAVTMAAAAARIRTPLKLAATS